MNKKQPVTAIQASPKREFTRHPKYGHVYGHKIVTPVGRLAWPYLVSPREGMDSVNGKGQPRYEATILLDEKNPKVSEFVAEVEKMATGMASLFNRSDVTAEDDDDTEGTPFSRKLKKQKKRVQLNPADLTIVKTEEDFDIKKYPQYKGMYVLVARNADKPVLIGINKTEVGTYTPVEAAKFIAGLLVRFVITPLLTIHGLSYKLNDVQLIRDDGKRYGGQQDSSGLLAEAEADLGEFLEDDKEGDESDIPLGKAFDLL